MEITTTNDDAQAAGDHPDYWIVFESHDEARLLENDK